MSEQTTTRRGRGKGKKPAKTLVNLRISQEVLDVYKTFPNYTGKMREVLTAYVQKQMAETASTAQTASPQLDLPLE
jgi:uncharacterized protein (DUF4415 family)